MKKFLALLSFLLSAASAENEVKQPSILASMTWSAEKGYQLINDRLAEGLDTVAWANFTNAINQTGWSYLEITTAEKFPDKIQVRRSINIYSFGE